MDINKEREAFEKLQNPKFFQRAVYLDNSNAYVVNNEYRDDLFSLEWVLEINYGWLMWQAAKATLEGFILVPTSKVKYFSNNGEIYETHETLAEAKHEAECAIEHFSDLLSDQQLDPQSDGNFGQVGYGIVLAESDYSIDHVVTQADVDNGDYAYEVGTQIMSLFLVEAQEQSHD